MSKSITKPSPGDAAAPDLHRHQRKCLVCNHPERDAIEEFFLRWHSPEIIETRFRVPEISVYRHAHALGLFARRAGNTRRALELIIERAEAARATGDTVIRAIRAYTCLTDDGRWVEPPTHVIFSTTSPLAGQAEAGYSAKAGLPVARPALANAVLPARDPDAELTGHGFAQPDELPQLPERVLIATPAIRNALNFLKTNENDSV